MRMVCVVIVVQNPVLTSPSEHLTLTAEPAPMLPRRCRWSAVVQDPPQPLKPCGFSQAFLDAYCGINSPNGHSRCFTVVITVCAALLIAAVIYQPRLAAKQQDYSYFDHVLSPSRYETYPGEPVLLTYYLKVCVASESGAGGGGGGLLTR
jgi:hypothetical protein